VTTEPFFTIGHSTRSIEAFAALLEEAQVRLVVDVRTMPRSRTNPQFNGDALPKSLAARGVGYEHLAALGGLRGRSKATPTETNAFWENRSFRNYADYAMTPAFRDGLDRLRALGHERRCAVMCAETLWWRCHRRIIADYLIEAGEPVFHIMGPGKIVPASLTPAARPAAPGTIAYPAAAAP
jgi:uncharacterized protein (DUF488 family)